MPMDTLSESTLPHLLLVEDEPAEISLLQKGLTAGPVPVHLHTVHSVEEALAFLRRPAPFHAAPRPQLIVTSLKLVGRQGLELLAEVKGDPALSAIPVIVLSLYNDPAIIRQSYILGANSYIIKPNELNALF